MGAVPFVWGTENGTLRVSGMASAPMRTVSDDELSDLVAARQAMRVEIALPKNPGHESLVALWIGKRFATLAIEKGVPIPPLPAAPTSTEDGNVAVTSTEEALARLESWIDRAFKVCMRTTDRALAALMAQVLPDHDLTQAALWKCAPDRDKESELAWFVRLRLDAGEHITATQLEKRFSKLCGDPPWARTKLTILISGRSGSKHREFAKIVGDQLTTSRNRKHKMVSFGEFLRGKFLAEHGNAEPTKRQLQDLGQQYIQGGAFSFARQVLGKAAANSPVLVIDGVRHESVQEAIEFIVHGIPILSLGIDASEQFLVKNLSQQRLGVNKIAEIQAHTSETEARKLIELIPKKIRYHTDGELPREAQRVLDWADGALAASN